MVSNIATKGSGSGSGMIRYCSSITVSVCFVSRDSRIGRYDDGVGKKVGMH